MDCPVCLDSDIAERACVLRCGHHLCNRCITQLRKPVCPTCRAAMYPDADQPPPEHEALDPAYFRDPDLMDGGDGDETYARVLARLDDPPAPRPQRAGNLAHFQRQFSTLTYSLLDRDPRPPRRS